MAEMKKNGRFPQMFAPDAVKKVVNPIQNTPNPMIRLATMSKLTLYFAAMTPKAGVTIGPRLSSSELRWKLMKRSAYAVVTPELNARRIMMDSFHIGDLDAQLRLLFEIGPNYQLRGSFGLSDGCGWRMMSPSRFSPSVCSIAPPVTSIIGIDSSLRVRWNLPGVSASLMVTVPGGAAICASSKIPKPMLTNDQMAKSIEVKERGLPADQKNVKMDRTRLPREARTTMPVPFKGNALS